MNVENLWGPLPEIENVNIPPLILKKQASMLREMTKGILEANVTTFSWGNDQFKAQLNIVAPFLDGYQITIIEITYSFEHYPVNVINDITRENFKALNEQDFVHIIKEILNSNSVQKVIGSLLLQSKVAS